MEEEKQTEKKCNACQEWFPATKVFFVTSSKSKGGLRPLCKPCRQLARRTTIPVVIPGGYKKCSRCKQILLADHEHFPIHTRAKDHLDNYCYPCRHEVYLEKCNRVQEQPPSHFTCKECEKVKPATEEFFVKDPSRRYGLSQICKVCTHIQQAVYRGGNKEKIALRIKRHRQTHRAQYNENDRRWRRLNPERHHENERRQRLANPEKFRQNKWRYNHSEHGRLVNRIHLQNRRSRIKQIGGSFTLEDIQLQYKRQRGRCYYCHKKVGNIYHIDHVIPITREGSSNDLWNLVIACPTCNQRKLNRLPHEWFEGGRLC